MLDLDSDPYNRRHGKFHAFHVMRGLRRRQRTGLEQKLINAKETDNVTSRAIVDRFNVATHHQHSTLY